MYVYLAGPMSSLGEPGPSLNAAVGVAATLLREGCAPFIPHLGFLADAIEPGSDWRSWSTTWLGRCDVLVRLPGESVGADLEVKLARDIGLPVVELGSVDYRELHLLPQRVQAAVDPRRREALDIERDRLEATIRECAP